MPRRSEPDELAAGGIFQWLGNFVARWPLLVIGFWIACAAVLMLTLPPLPVVAAQHQAKPLPDYAPTMVAQRAMSGAFHETGAGSLLLLILTDENGMSPADEDTYRQLIDNLHQDKQDKISVQEFVSAPPLREILASKDNKAWNVPINIEGELLAPETQEAYKHVAEIVKKTLAGSTLTAHYAGTVALAADATEIGQHDLHVIEIGTGLLVLGILFLVYRNLVTMLVPLATIGLSVVTAQGVLAGLALMGLPTGLQTIVLMSAVMVGAGTDYAVFLISRYHDYLKLGADSDQAVKNALLSIGKVIAASAATVAVTFLAMIFATLEVFSTVGPAISIAVIVAFLAAVTLLPAILVLAGRRGWIKPRGNQKNLFWRRTGTRVVRKPWLHLVASGVVLVILAGSASFARFNYDDIKTLPRSEPSVSGYAVMDRHFAQNAMTPMLLLIQSSHDLRAPGALADLEQMAARISQLPDITLVRGITRPNGGPLEQTKVSYQAGEVGGKLDEASNVISTHGGDLDKLSGGANQLADALAMVRTQVNGAVGTVSTLVTALTAMQATMGGDKTLNDLDRTAQLAGRMRSLGDALSANMSDVENTVAWARPMVAALNASPVCSADPGCANSRRELQALVNASANGTLNSIGDLARNLRDTQETQSIGSTVSRLQQSLSTAVNALRSTSGLQAKVAQMQQGANALADGSRAIADGVQELVKQTKTLGSGLNQASSFLLGMKHDAQKSSMAGFNIPPQILTTDDFKKAAQIFISPDGHAARYFVQSAISPFTTAAMDQVDRILAAARSAQPNTELSDATVSLAGIPTGLADTRSYYDQDLNFIVIATVLIVFLILVALLRAIIAPLYLIASVLISFLSALGIGVIVFQFILGQSLHWSIPGLSFILLVAVGADYNMLLISRIRDESPHGVRVGVIRTVGSTGGVITSAGLIFAASMFGLVAASITTMVEAGFVIGIGIVLDTFLVRTITVPAMAALVNRANWWPSKLGQTSRRRSLARKPVRKPKLLARLPWFNGDDGRETHAATPPLPAISVASVQNGHVIDDPILVHALPLFGLKRLRERLADAQQEAASDFLTTLNANGIRPTEQLPDHALPLFGPYGLPHYRLKTTTNGQQRNGNGNRPTNHLAGHPLPPFGPKGLRHYRFPITAKIHANGNGHTNGNGHAKGNGYANGNGSRSLDHAEELADKSGVT